MDPLFWLWFLALGLPVVMWLMRPWRMAEQELRPVSEEEQKMSELLARKEAVMDALAELEVDYRAGKLTTEDYERLKQTLMDQAAAILKALDDLQARLQTQAPATAASAQAVPQEPAKPSTSQEARAQPRPEAPAGHASSPDDLEQRLQARRRERSTRFVGFCPSCGAALRAGQRFCHWCGQPVPEALLEGTAPEAHIPA